MDPHRDPDSGLLYVSAPGFHVVAVDQGSDEALNSAVSLVTRLRWPRAIWLGVLRAFAMDACPSGSPGGVLTSSQNAAWRYDVAPNPSGVSLSTPPLPWELCSLRRTYGARNDCCCSVTGTLPGSD